METCEQATTAYKAAVASSTPWALQMQDASCVFPDGLLAAFGPRFGHFDQCLAASSSAPFASKFCMVKYQPSIVRPLSKLALVLRAEVISVAVDMAVCVPAACDADTSVDVATFNLRHLLDRFGGEIQPSQCFTDTPLDGGAIAFLCVASILCALTLFATVTDKIPCFSARRNLRALFAHCVPSTVHCVHGIRCLSMCWVVFGHEFYYRSLAAPPPSELISPLPWASAVLLNIYLGVDTFLLLSAFLSARAIARAKRLPIVLFYVLRWVRLWGPLAAFVFFTACASSLVARGPLWGPIILSEAEFCKRRWWTTLLFLNNYLDSNPPQSNCLSFSWYLSVDTQLAWLSPLVLFPLLRWPKAGVALAAFLLAATVSTIFALTWIYSLPWTLSLVSDLDKIEKFWYWIYINTPLRAQPYLVGLLLGFFLEQPVKRLSKPMAALGWFSSLTLLSLSLFGLMLSHNGPLKDDNLAAAAYSSVHRILWSFGLSWIIFACHKGHGGLINKILSWKVWVPLSRLTYCIFLTHSAFISMQTASLKTSRQFSFFDLIHGYFGDITLVFLPALLLHLTVEAPVNGFIKMYLKRAQAKHN